MSDKVLAAVSGVVIVRSPGVARWRCAPLYGWDCCRSSFRSVTARVRIVSSQMDRRVVSGPRSAVNVG